MAAIKLEITLFDPSVDEAPHVETFEYPADQEGEVYTVLKALRWINENTKSITYDYNCRWGGCGRCGVMVDGVPKLACWARIEPGKTYKVGPLDAFPVIKDLVVDREVAYDRFVQADLSNKTYKPLTEIAPEEPNLWWGAEDGSDDGMTPKDFNRCRECMSCYTVCQALNDFDRWNTFVGPGAMMQIAGRHFDPVDQADRLGQAVLSGVFECVGCGNCTQVCPAHIDIKRVNEYLQDAAVKEGLVDGTEARGPLYPML